MRPKIFDIDIIFVNILMYFFLFDEYDDDFFSL